MLGQRILTAVVLLALLVPALLAGTAWPFAALTIALLAAAGWEWARLHGAGKRAAWGMGAVLLAACVASAPAALDGRVPTSLWYAVALAWVAGSAWALWRGVEAWHHLTRWMAWPLGFCLLWAAWMALVEARVQGLGFALSVFSLVWVADIAAYFGGRAFGKRKLAAAISPGKTWEGVWTGVIGVMLLGWIWLSVETPAAWGTDLFSLSVQRFGLAGAWVCWAGLAAMSVVGDLFESLIKRAAGVKDSSQLLPGHGGVLDRIDALLPVFPIAMALSAT